jgi:hypothetical protein
MQYADCCPWAMFSTHKPIRMTGERSVPLSSGLAICCTLADSFGGLKGRGRMCEVVRHGKRVSIEFWPKMGFTSEAGLVWERVADSEQFAPFVL